jgi:hypothetical protein
MTIDFAALAAEFPRDAVSWRAQSVIEKDGAHKALALAYIDARDVMRRLDEVCGPAGWSDRYEIHGPKTICYLTIEVDGKPVTKADGAGDSDVEAEKGAISDAFKRAAVKWGIGRYLYDIETPWVPCEIGRNGKWKKFKGDPWDHVRKPAPARQAAPRPQPQLVQPTRPTRTTAAPTMALARSAIDNAEYADELTQWWRGQQGKRTEYGIVKGSPEYDELLGRVANTRDRLPANVTAAG